MLLGQGMTTHGIAESSAGTARRAVDRSASANRTGSVILVLLVAAMLVAAATGFVVLRPRLRRAVHPRLPRGACHSWRFFAVRACRRHPAAADGGAGQPAYQIPCRRCFRRHPRHRRRWARHLCKRCISRSYRRCRRERYAAGGARVHWRRRRIRSDLQAVESGARGQAPARGGARRRDQGTARALAAAARKTARRKSTRPAA